MKKITFLFLCITTSFFCQTNTEIHVFDIVNKNGEYLLKNGKNISNNKGYDSQPFFYSDHEVIYASNKNGNTEIVLHNLNSGENYQKSNTEKGGEYSPQKIPNSKNVSAVRFDFKTGKNKEIIPNLKVAYPSWYDKNTVIASVIVNDSLHLIISDLQQKTNTTVAKMVGRSIHKIPNTNLVSFISKENKDYWLLKSLNPETKEIKTITSLGKSEDVTWLINGTLLIANGSSIYKFNPEKDKRPSIFFSFTDENINNISRISVNAISNKLAIVAEVSPEYLATAQLVGYNNRDIDAFLKPFAKNVKVYNYPNKLSYEGLDKMRKNYTSFFENTPDLHCKILKRIVFKDKVIDHELVTASNLRKVPIVSIFEMGYLRNPHE